jgi:hypothetical protein
MLAIAGGLAIALQSSWHRVVALAAMIAGLVALLVARFVARRISDRPFDVDNGEIAALDLDVRRASLEVVSSIAVALALCATAWLAAAARPVGTRVSSNGVKIFEQTPARNVHVTTINDPTTSAPAISITWDDRGGRTRTTNTPIPSFDSVSIVPTHPVLEQVMGLAAIVAGIWAFGEWRRVARVPIAYLPLVAA